MYTLPLTFVWVDFSKNLQKIIHISYLLVGLSMILWLKKIGQEYLAVCMKLKEYLFFYKCVKGKIHSTVFWLFLFISRDGINSGLILKKSGFFSLSDRSLLLYVIKATDPVIVKGYAYFPCHYIYTLILAWKTSGWILNWFFFLVIMPKMWAPWMAWKTSYICSERLLQLVSFSGTHALDLRNVCFDKQHEMTHHCGHIFWSLIYSLFFLFFLFLMCSWYYKCH